jgi:hypothetical protein
MAEQLTCAKKNSSRDFRVHTASTKVTQSELAELEQAAAARGIRLIGWIREVLLRELQGTVPAGSGAQVNFGRRALTEIVGQTGLAPAVSDTLSPSRRQIRCARSHLRTMYCF